MRARLAVFAAVLCAGCALVPGAGAERAVTLPRAGVFVPGVSLAGVRLGDTQARVRSLWGGGFRLCKGCDRPTWLYLYPDQPVGAGVAFRDGRVVAVFTLGSPLGWRTSDGLGVGELTDRVTSLYPSLHATACVGYSAWSARRGGATSSILIYGENVYGFALARATEPVCI